MDLYDDVMDGGGGGSWDTWYDQAGRNWRKWGGGLMLDVMWMFRVY